MDNKCIEDNKPNTASSIEKENTSFLDKLANKIPAQFRIPILMFASSCGLISIMMNSGFNDPAEIERIIVKINSNPENIPVLIRDFNLEVPEEYLALIEGSSTISLELGLDTNKDKYIDSEVSIISDGENYPIYSLERYSGSSDTMNFMESTVGVINGVRIEVERTVFENSECRLTHSLEISTIEDGESSQGEMIYYEHKNFYTIFNNDGSEETIDINNLNVPMETPYVNYGDQHYTYIGLMPISDIETVQDCIDAYNQIEG